MSLLMLACLMALLLVALTQLVAGEPGGCTETDDEVPLVQKMIKRNRMQDYASEETVISEYAALDEINLGSVAAKCGGGAKITEACWRNAFSEYDRTGDGVIDARDLQLHREVEKMSHENLTVRDYQLGVVLAAEILPERANLLLENSALIVQLAYDDVQLPEGIPTPPDPLSSLPRIRRPISSVPEANTSNITAMLLQKSGECVSAILQVAMGSLNIVSSIVGVTLPSSSSIAPLITAKADAMSEIFALVSEFVDDEDGYSLLATMNASINASNHFSRTAGEKTSVVASVNASMMLANMDASMNATMVQVLQSRTERGKRKMAQLVWNVFHVMYKKGIFSELLQEYLSSLSWWQYSIQAAIIATRVAAHFGTGGASIALSIVLALREVPDVYNGIYDIKDHCLNR